MLDRKIEWKMQGTLRVVMLILSIARIGCTEDYSSDVIQLNGENFDKELMKRPLLVLFHLPR